MSRYQTLLEAEQIESYTQAGYWQNRLLVDHLDAHADATPDKVAIIDSRGSIIYSELRALAQRCARALVAIGLRPGDAISIQLPNWIEFAAMCLGAARVGVVICPIAPIHRDRELACMLELAEVKLALTGYGRASKRQMQEMLKLMLGLDDIPRPDDAADAAAIAVCHLHSVRLRGLLMPGAQAA